MKPGNWYGTGITQQDKADNIPFRIPEYDRRIRQHYFVISAMFQYVPGQQPVMSLRTMVATPLVACYHCEKGYTDELASTACEGDPA